MANIRIFLKRRKAVQSTRKITRTMELVATARLQRAQQAALRARPYASLLRETVMELLAAGGDETPRHPLMEKRGKISRAAVLVLTSDRGLCGSFNSGILRAARSLLADLSARGVAVELICSGRKGLAAFKWHGIPVAKAYSRISDKPDIAVAREIAEYLSDGYVGGRIDEAIVVYSRFESVSRQVPCAEVLLPIGGAGKDGCDGLVARAARGAMAAEDAVSGKPRSAAEHAEPRKKAAADFIYHPDPARILDGILPLWIKTAIFAAMLENAAGEQAARRLAMKNATDNADEMIVLLTRQYNRARQARITQEIAEIVGGAEAL